MAKIRLASEEDREAVLGLWRVSGCGEIETEEWRALADGTCANLLVADDEGGRHRNRGSRLRWLASVPLPRCRGT